MARRDRDAPPASIPRIDPKRWEDFSVFRETFLEEVTEPATNAALRTVAELHYKAFIECDTYWPCREEPFYYSHLRAALADLRHLQGFLQDLFRIEEFAEEYEGEEIAMAPCLRLAERAVGGLGKLADDMERELDALQASGLPPVSEQK